LYLIGRRNRLTDG